MSGPLLTIEDLRVHLSLGDTWIAPVDGVTLSVERGEFLGIAGESGSGKSLTLRSIVGLLPAGSRVEGRLLFSLDGETQRQLDVEEVRGHGVAMIFQEPMTALNPTMRVGDLIAEGPRVHRGLSRADAKARAIELMGLVGIPDPRRRARHWPHQLSGGLRQRVMIATALSTDPKLLLCDEPTTALDVTIQDQILGLLDGLRRDLGMSIVLVTHDLAVIAEVCDRLAVMYAGRIVELGGVDEVLSSPRHPYTVRHARVRAVVPRRLRAAAGDGRSTSRPPGLPQGLPVRSPMPVRARRLPERALRA